MICNDITELSLLCAPNIVRRLFLDHFSVSSPWPTSGMLQSDEDVSCLLAKLEAEPVALARCEGIIRTIRKMKEHTFCGLELHDSKTVVQLVFEKECTGVKLQNMDHVRVGAVVRCSGRPACDRPGNLSLYVGSLTILRCSTEPDAIKRVVCDASLSNSEASLVLACTIAEVELLRSVAAAKTGTSELKQAVAKHSRKMLGKPSRRSRQREHRVSRPDLEVLENAEKTTALWCVSSSDEDADSTSIDGKEDQELPLLDSCEHEDIHPTELLNIPGSASAPSSRGPMTRGEYMHGRKQPQIRWLVQKMRTMGSFTHVLDIGGGRGDLAVLIALSFPHAQVTVIDANMSSLQQGRAYAKTMGDSVYGRIRFVCGRLTPGFQIQDGTLLTDDDQLDHQTMDTCDTGGNSNVPTAAATASIAAVVETPVDFVVALHACGGLSDLALHYAAEHGFKFLVCPCCYLKTPYFPPATQSVDGVVLCGGTGGAQCPGAALSPTTGDVQEPAVAEKMVLLRLAESDNRDCSYRAGVVVNSQRLNRLHAIVNSTAHAYSDGNGCLDSDVKWQLGLDSFPMQYSLRNLVLSLGVSSRQTQRDNASPL